MIKLKDIPQDILKDIRSYRIIQGKDAIKIFNKYNALPLLEDIKQQYKLTDFEVAKHIHINLPLTEHTCKICGKHLSWSKKRGKFPEYCGLACIARDPESKKKSKHTNRIKYGCDAPLQNKDILKKAQTTCVARYGVKNPQQNKTIQQKSTNTLLVKYGTTTTFKSPAIAAKCQSTMLERYGCINPMQNKQLVQKAKYTNKERYGTTCVLTLPENRKKCSDQQKLLQKQIIKQTKERILSVKRDILFNSLNSSPVIPLFSPEEYIGCHHTIIYKWRCKECGREFESNFIHNQIPVCRSCHPFTTSRGQAELLDYIKSITPSNKDIEIIVNTRKPIKPYEIDIFIPEYNLAIEYNGSYWHSDKNAKPNNYHVTKTKLAEKEGIRLIHIWEHDWNQKQELIKQRLYYLFNKGETVIYARNCTIKECPYVEIEDFLNTYHLQGSIRSKVNLGLYYSNNLVAVMTFGKPRFNKQYEWELLRFASKGHIIGGASKLLKYFERNYNPTSLISYANRDWSQTKGNLYEYLGFNLSGETKPNYIYVNSSQKIIPRYRAQKHKLKDLLGEENFNPDLSEYENMKNNGWFRLYDCGNLVWTKQYN